MKYSVASSLLLLFSITNLSYGRSNPLSAIEERQDDIYSPQRKENIVKREDIQSLPKRLEIIPIDPVEISPAEIMPLEPHPSEYGPGTGEGGGEGEGEGEGTGSNPNPGEIGGTSGQNGGDAQHGGDEEGEGEGEGEGEDEDEDGDDNNQSSAAASSTTAAIRTSTKPFALVTSTSTSMPINTQNEIASGGLRFGVVDQLGLCIVSMLSVLWLMSML